MPNDQNMHVFREGLKILQNARDFSTLRATINKMVSLVLPEDLVYARDAIARVIRIKQATEMQEYRNYPQAMNELDKKYQDLYLVLKRAIPQSQQIQPQSVPLLQTAQVSNQIKQQDSGQLQMPNLGEFMTPLLLVNWLKSKKNILLAGTAVAGSIGGAYWLYKYLISDAESKVNKTDDSLDRTIKSIQKYKAFSEMMKNPDFSGNLDDIYSGKVLKKKKVEKKDDKIERFNEWDSDERSLMHGMDEAFNALSFRPNLEYKLPQLPAPKNIDPSIVLNEKTNEKVIESIIEKKEKKNENFFRETKEFKTKNENSKIVNKTDFDSSGGRLIPIIKRTKRVKKIGV